MRIAPPLLALALLLGVAAAQNPPAPQGGNLLNLPSAPGEDPGVKKARALLEEMVQALGGQAYLNVQDMTQEGRTYGFSHGESAGEGVLFWRFWKWPDKDRIELTKKRDWAIVNNGDKGYEITFRGTAAEEAELVEDYNRRRHYSLEHVLRVWLKQPGIALFYEGQALAERKQADVVTILNAQNEAVTIYIDQTTHLPIRKSFTWRDPKYRDKNEEAEGYANYRPVQGIMTPFDVTRYKQGDTVNQRFLTSVRYNQNLPDSLFNVSITWDPSKVKGKK